MTKIEIGKISSLIAFFGLLTLGACGTRGEVPNAPPMWGKAKAEYDAEQAKKKAEAEKDQAATPANSN